MGIDWFVLIIPAIAIGIWAFRNVIERSNEANRNVPPAGRPVGQRPRSATAEIDRFLEEVNRRRQMQQQRQTQARRPQEPIVVEAVEVAPPPIAPRARPVPPRVRAATPAPSRRQTAQSDIALAAVAQRVAAVEVLPALPALRFEAPPAVTSVSRPVPQQLQQLRALLRSASGLRTAFVLNEIVGSPRCRRPFRRA
jgi:hypothetical protein